MKSLSKELFIIALLLMIVVLMIGMIFYEYMPNNKTVPDAITYVADSTTTAVLQEIAATTTETVAGTSSEAQSVIKSYSIGTKELGAAESRQSYTSGKTDPFAEYQGPSTDGNTTNTNTVVDGNTVNTGTTSSGNQNPNSTGTFFENKSSK